MGLGKDKDLDLFLVMEGKLEHTDKLFQLSPGDKEDDVHYEYHRECKLKVSEGHRSQEGVSD